MCSPNLNSAMTCHGTCLINLYCTSVHFKLKTHYWSSFYSQFCSFHSLNDQRKVQTCMQFPSIGSVVQQFNIKVWPFIRKTMKATGKYFTSALFICCTRWIYSSVDENVLIQTKVFTGVLSCCFCEFLNCFQLKIAEMSHFFSILLGLCMERKGQSFCFGSLLKWLLNLYMYSLAMSLHSMLLQ